MSIRTTTSTVSFSRPFVLTGVADQQPAGSYTVETDKELLQHVSVSASANSTLIRLPPLPGSTEWGRIIDLDPLELTPVLASDVKAENQPALFPSRVAIEPQQMKHATRQFPPRAWKAGWQSWLAMNANELTWTALVGAGVILTALFADR